MSQIAEKAREIASRSGDLDASQVEQEIERISEQFSIPVDEAARTVAQNHGVSSGDTQSRRELKLGEIESGGFWCDVPVVKVVDEREPYTDDMAFAGYVADETGRMRCVVWKDSGVPDFSVGDVFSLENVKVSQKDDSLSLSVGRYSEVYVLGGDIEVAEPEPDAAFIGAVVDIQSGSGLIKRCSYEDCTRTLNKGRCSQHGSVDGEYDLRIKAVLDDGRSVQRAVFDAERTERLIGMDVDEARDRAMESFDPEIIEDDIKEQVLGRYYWVEGREFDEWVAVNEVSEPPRPDAEKLLRRAIDEA